MRAKMIHSLFDARTGCACRISIAELNQCRISESAAVDRFRACRMPFEVLHHSTSW